MQKVWGSPGQHALSKMPELPEVETTCRGIAPHVIDKNINSIIVRDSRLRWPVEPAVSVATAGRSILKVERRAKYILLQLDNGHLIIHLGMSGSLRILDEKSPHEKHDHLDICLNSGVVIRYRDPRRFGSVHWTCDDPYKYWLLKDLGPEPFSEEFTGAYLYKRSRGRSLSVKLFIMDSHNVVGVGNIYANEALFQARIRPHAQAGKISLPRYERLAKSIKIILNDAIAQGGTTLRDFVSGAGRPGYFQQELSVYGRGGQPCRLCNRALRVTLINQRATYYCGTCQR
jgi:formamidopyrimidine-DNA glycosylase